MKIALIGACDRNNYGDLLMPIVFEKQFTAKNKNKNIQFSTYGMIDSNMKSLLCNKTNSLYKCYNNCDIAIIVGGEVLKSDYKLMYFNLQKNFIKIFVLKCLNKIFPEFIEKYSRKKLKGYEQSPWILDKDKLKCTKLIYNTVGGSLIKEEVNRSIIKKCDYISIRNINDYKKISVINKKTTMYPDSMVTISNYFSDDEFSKYVSQDIKNITKKDYFVVQIDKRDSKGEIKKISEQIDLICQKYNINCILLPIGYAQGHEDHIALKKILNLCNSKRVTMCGHTNIYETTYILKEAKVFIGTSLHGIVISTSYSVPHIVLTNKIKKLIDYMETWKTATITYTDVLSMEDNFSKIYNNLEVEIKKLDSIRKEIIEKAEENFDSINNIINGVYYDEQKN